MKWMHWVAIVLGGLVTGLTSAEGELAGTPLLVVRVLVAVAGALLPVIAATSPNALPPKPAAPATSSITPEGTTLS